MSDIPGYYDTSYPPSLWTPVPDPPTLTASVPNTGVTGTPASLNITGTGFTADTTIRMGGTAMTTTFVDATHLTAAGTLPAAGTVQLTATNVNGLSNQIPFTVTAAEEPEVVAESTPDDYEESS